MHGRRRDVAPDRVQERLVPDPRDRASLEVAALAVVDHVRVVAAAERAAGQREAAATATAASEARLTRRLHLDEPVRGDVGQARLLAVRASARPAARTCAAPPSPKWSARILGREVAAAGVRPRGAACARPGAPRSPPRPGGTPSSSTSSQLPPPCSCSRAGRGARRPSRRRRRGRRRCRSRPPRSRAPSRGPSSRPAARRRRRSGRPPSGSRRAADGSASAARSVTGTSPLATTRSRSVSRSRSAQVTPQPVEPAEPAPRSSRTSSNDGSLLVRRLAAVDRVRLPAGVGDEEVGAAVAVVVAAGDPHPAVRVGHARPDAARSSKRKPRPAGSASAPPGHGDVLVQPVRVRVVGEVDVEVAVAVEVREDDAEPVLEARRPRARPRTPTSRNVDAAARRGPRSGRAGRGARGTSREALASRSRSAAFRSA